MAYFLPNAIFAWCTKIDAFLAHKFGKWPNDVRWHLLAWRTKFVDVDSLCCLSLNFKTTSFVTSVDQFLKFRRWPSTVDNVLSQIRSRTQNWWARKSFTNNNLQSQSDRRWFIIWKFKYKKTKIFDDCKFVFIDLQLQGTLYSIVENDKIYTSINSLS